MSNKIFNLSFLLTLLLLGSNTVFAQFKVFDNGKIRIGNGNENSINGTGNLQQPFYYNLPSTSWRPLTYSTLALNSAFGVGGDGTNVWNYNGTVLGDASQSGQTIDYSQYVSTGANKGYGKIVSTGNITVGTALLQIQNTFTLGQDASFIQIKCKVTNVGSAAITNVRGWIGTRDDWVGTTDNPTKTKGNLVNDQFQAITSQATQAKAIKIESGAEGVLYFSNKASANTFISGIGRVWPNAQNPATSAITSSGDQCYAMYVRFNDLAVGASDEFTLYYAAGAVADLDDIINEVAQSSGAISNITSNSAIFKSTTNTASTGYFVVVPAGSTAPTDAQIAAGIDYGTTHVVSHGSASMAANTQVTFNLAGLSPSTGYTLYFVTNNGTTYSSVFDAEFSTLAALVATAQSHTNVACNGGSTGSATVSVTGGLAPYTYVWTGSSSTSATASNLAAGDYTVTVTDANGETTTQDFTITENPALTATTSQTDVSCKGGSNGTATVEAAGGSGTYSYAWTPAAGIAATATGLSATDYTCTITDNLGCSITKQFTIAEPVAALSATISGTDVKCNGGTDGTATVVASGGTAPYAYVWTSSASIDATATGLAAGDYTCTITDAAGCITSQSITIAEPAVLAATESHTDASCFGVADGTITINVTGGTGTYNYAWSISGATDATATGLAAGDYTCTVTDANGCATTPVTITVTEPPQAIVDDITSQEICNTGATQTIAFTGPVSGTTFSWTNDNPAIGLAASGTGDIASFNAVNTGNTPVTATITVTPQAGSPCAGPAKTFTITVNPSVKVISVAVPANDTYLNGVDLDFTVTYNQDVTVSGTPFIPVTLNTGGTVHANYVSGNGASLLFRYTVQPGHLDSDGIAVAGTINLNGGTITGGCSGDAVTLHNMPSVTGILVQGQLPQTITFNALAAKTYGDADFVPGATASSNLDVTYTSSNTAVATIVNGQVHIVGEGTTTLTATQAGNTYYQPAADQQQELVINRKTITVTAAAQSKTYGDADPALTYTFAPALVSGDAFSGALSRAAGENAGTYAITQGSLALSNNYQLVYNAAGLVINRKTITVTAAAKTKVYGDADPALTYTSAPALVTGDAFSGTLTRAAGENAGTYAIQQGSLALSNNYQLAYNPANLVINKAELTVTSDSKIICYGDAAGTIPVSYAGFKNGESGVVLTRRPSVSIPSYSGAGTYTLLPDGGTAANYSFTYAAGTLTVLPVPTGSITSTATAPGVIDGFMLMAPAGTGFTWNTGETTQEIRVQSSGTYSVTVVNAAGCSVNFSIPVQLKTLSIPNTFSPNGDGINDYWTIPELRNYPGAYVQVVNRDGQIMFESQNFTRWDGRISGNVLPAGVYFYRVRLANSTTFITGWLNLVR